MKKKLKWIIPVCVVIVLIVAFGVYAGDYYRADATALKSLESDETVHVTKTDYGWFFDGPSESDALVFYPGGKVQDTAYASLMRELARQGIDVCLVKMPFNLAVFNSGKASDVMNEYEYTNWYIGGHSLGGAMAANYAASHGDKLSGVILLAAYPTKALDSHLFLISIYGSEDGVLNRAKATAGKQYVPGRYIEYVIDGGNHAQFGNYGKQSGDGEATISAEEQQRLAAEFIMSNFLLLLCPVFVD